MIVLLSIGTSPAKELREHGATQASLITSATAEDSLRIMGPWPLDSVQLIAPYQKCTLVVDGSTRFVGWLDQAPQKAAGNEEEWTYTLTGPWRWLMRCYYQAPTLVEGEKVLGASGFTRLGGKVGYVALTDEDLAEADKEHVTVRAQLIEFLNFAKARHPGKWDYVIEEGAFNIEIPFEDRENDLCGNIIRALLAYAPTAVMWWDYSGSVPTLRFADRNATLPATKVLTEVGPTQLPTLNPRYDLMADGVEIIYLAEREDEVEPSPGKTELKARVTRTVEASVAGGDAAGMDPSPDFTVTINKSLQRGEEQPAAGLANTLARYYQQLHIDAQPTFWGIDWSRTAGELWTFGGVFARYAGRKSVCRQIVRDLFLVSDTLTLGAPTVPSTFNLGKRSAANPPAPESSPPNDDDDDDTGELSVTISGLDDESLATWSVVGAGGSGGSGESTVELAPGSYTVVFHPVVKDGVFYAAPSVSVDVTEGGTATATGAYEETILGGAGGDHAFKIIKRAEYSGDPPEVVAWSVSVEAVSKMRAGYTGVDRAISGLGDWMEATAGTYIYLKGEISAGPTFSSASISQESSVQDAVTISGSEQTGFAVEIGRIVTDPEDADGIKIIQSVHSHLRLLNDCHNGVPILYPMPLS